MYAKALVFVKSLRTLTPFFQLWIDKLKKYRTTHNWLLQVHIMDKNG